MAVDPAPWASHHQRGRYTSIRALGTPTRPDTADSHRRTHILPWFGAWQLRDITPTPVQQWQDELEAGRGYDLVMACRSLLRRTLEAARKERLIPYNPVLDVDPPARPQDPAARLGEVPRRVPTPQEAGKLLAYVPEAWCDHVVSLFGTGLRIGELGGLRVARVDLLRRELQVAPGGSRYQAGSKYGSGFKDPKSATSFRRIPLAWQVVEAISRQIPPGSPPEELVFCGPGGGPGAPKGTRTVLSRHNFRRMWERAAAEAALDGLELGGPHTARHAFATWLAAELPGWVVDDLMGHSRGNHEQQRSAESRIGHTYRHLLPEMRKRAAGVIECNLDAMLAAAAAERPTVEAKRAKRRAQRKAGRQAKRRAMLEAKKYSRDVDGMLMAGIATLPRFVT